MPHGDLVALRALLGEWLEYLHGEGIEHPLVRSTEETYAFVNATLAHSAKEG